MTLPPLGLIQDIATYHLAQYITLLPLGMTLPVPPCTGVVINMWQVVDYGILEFFITGQYFVHWTNFCSLHYFYAWNLYSALPMLIHSLEKSHLTANTFVSSASPLNKTTPDRPGRKSSLICGCSQISTTKFSNCPMIGHKIGQNDACSQYGVPTAEHAWAWRITLGIRLMGRHHQ